MNVLTTLEQAIEAAPERTLAERLATGLAPKLLPVFEDVHAEIVALAGDHGGLARASSHASIVGTYCAQQRDEIARLNRAEQNFQIRLLNAVDQAEQRATILEFAAELGAERSQLKSDRKAFDAYFDADAIIERFHKRVGERERALAHAVDRLGFVTADAIRDNPMLVHGAFFVELSQNLLEDMRKWRGDARVRVAAHSCLATIAAHIDSWPFGAWFEAVLSATRRVCLTESEDVWVQCAAFDALLALSPNSIATAILARISQPIAEKPAKARDNELFLRRHLGRILCRNYTLNEHFPKALATLARDKSGAVRQALADCLEHLPENVGEQLFTQLRKDTDPQVRAALFADIPRMALVIKPELLADHIAHILERDSDDFVLRIALDAAAALAQLLRRENRGSAEEIIAQLAGTVDAFQNRDLKPKIRRWADEAYEKVWLLSDPETIAIATIIRNTTCDQREATFRTIVDLKPYLDEDSNRVGRVMATLVQNDFGLSLKVGKRPKIQRGEWIKRRLWRIMFERRHPATDKRQAFLHTTGRDFYGTIQAPSARMAELAPTKVPGEPLFEAAEGGWRNYLPLVDQVLATLDSGKVTQIFTSAGITTLTPPGGLARRVRLYWSLSRNFSAIAGQRNREPREFVAKLRALGFAIDFTQHPDRRGVNPAIEMLFTDNGSSND